MERLLTHCLTDLPPGAYFVLHTNSTGGLLEQAIDSFIPRAIVPHAVDWAERAASSRVDADADAQFR
jgi:hypothetical protein